MSNKNIVVNRRYDIDWLRNIAILLLFPFHAARVFDYWEPNYVMNSELSWGLSWFITVAAYWFMPLLFFLAGATSRYALFVRSNRQFLKERTNRLFIPLIVGLVIIVPPQCYYALKYHQEFKGSYIDSVVIFFTDFSDLTGYYGSFTPAHLWFILYLFIMSFLLILLKNFLKKIISSEIMYKNWVLLLLFIPLTLSELLPSPGGKNLFYFFFIFVVGFLIGTDEKVMNKIKNIRFKSLLILIPYIPIWLTLAYMNLHLIDDFAVGMIFAFIKNFALLLTLVVILGYGQKLVSVNNRFLKYMNEAAYPFYILHQSILIVISFYIVNLNIGVSSKFILITLLTLISCICLFEVIKRMSITRWMLGMKPRQKSNYSESTKKIRASN